MARPLARRMLSHLGGAAIALFLLITYLSIDARVARVASHTVDRGSTLRSALQRADRVGLSTSQGGHLWDEVLVVNLPHRADRRAHMDKLSAALGLPFTFMSAISTGHSVVPWILERLLDDQEQAEHTASGLKAFVPSADWNGTGGTWRAQALRVLEDESLSFDLQRSQTDLEALVYPPAYRKTASIDPHGPTACSLSHLKAMKHAIDSNAQSVLILEDDVDTEFNLAVRWEEMSRALATREEGWDVVYLGFIWANERWFKPTFHPGLRRAFGPAGTHAYSLSHRGLRRLYAHLTEGPTLFQRPIDHEIPQHVIAGLRLAEERGEPRPWQFEAFSAVPPLVIPGGDVAGLGTDIGGIGGTLWGGLLADSALRRIAEHEGQPLTRPTDDEVLAMLAVQNM